MEAKHWEFIKDGEQPEFKRLPSGNIDPVFKKATGEYGFCDETWADSYGPYATYEEANAGCAEYAKTI